MKKHPDQVEAKQTENGADDLEEEILSISEKEADEAPGAGPSYRAEADAALAGASRYLAYARHAVGRRACRG